MDVGSFDQIIEKAKSSGIKYRVVLAGADSENILLGAFQAQDEGFVELTLVGEKEVVRAMLEKLGLKDREYRMIKTFPGDNVTQIAIEAIRRGEGDILMRGNVQTREFLMPLLDSRNELRTDRLVNQFDIVAMPGYPRLLVIGDDTVIVEPNKKQKREIVKNMVDVLHAISPERPNIAMLALVEQPNFHMRDTVEAYDVARKNESEPFVDCNLVGPIAYDLVFSKEAARLKGFECDCCGEFDGIVAPSLLAGNLIVKGLKMNAHAKSAGVVVGAKIPVAIASRSDTPDVSFNSLALAALLAQQKK